MVRICAVEAHLLKAAIIFCPKLREMWKNSGWWRYLKAGKEADFMHIAEFLVRELETDEYAVWCMTAWKVWSFVCDWVYGEKGKEGARIVEDSRILWNHLQRARVVMGGEKKLGVKVGEMRWRRPPEGVIRVDVDVLFNEEANKFGVGVILRDWNGRIVMAMSKRTSRKANVMAAETMAVIEGIILSVKAEVELIIVHTDSLLVARLMAVPEEIEELVPEDIAEMIIQARESLLIEVKHMYRSANRASHELAQRSIEVADEIVWKDEYPIWLCDIVNEDLHD